MQWLTTGPQAPKVIAQTINFLEYRSQVPPFFQEPHRIMGSNNPMRTDFHVFQDTIRRREIVDGDGRKVRRKRRAGHGRASGIGEATAKRLLHEGARVVIADRDDRRSMERALAEMGALGEVYGVRGDVSLPEDADRMVGESLDRLGRLDVLINNAGICMEEEFLDIPLEHWDATIAVNLRGMFLMGQRAARAMVEANKGGAIVNTSSTNGIVGEAKYAHYNASKGGVTLLTKSMAIDLAPHGIRVNAVCPGYILTPMAESVDTPEFVAEYIKKFIPLGRAGRPEEVTALFAFLASDDALFMTGECVVIDGGQLTF